MSGNTITFEPSRMTISGGSIERIPRLDRPEPADPEKNARPRVASLSKPPETPETKVYQKIASPAVTFQVDKDSGEAYIQVIDRDSGEVLRQIPPEEMRKLAVVLKEMMGNVVDTVA